MQLLRFSSSLTLVITIAGFVVLAASNNTYGGRHLGSWSELRNALRDLGYDSAEGLHKPQPSEPPQGVSVASQNKGCLKTVSVLACFRHHSRFSLKV